MDFIRNILEGNNLNPLLDLDTVDTEAFINTTNDFDIRNVLKKKLL